MLCSTCFFVGTVAGAVDPLNSPNPPAVPVGWLLVGCFPEIEAAGGDWFLIRWPTCCSRAAAWLLEWGAAALDRAVP